MPAKTHIRDGELQRRMSLLGYDSNAQQLLAAYKHFFEDNIDTITEDIYRKLAVINEPSLLIKDEGTLQNICNAQQHYIMALFSGHYDHEYINTRSEIGKLYKNVGLDPKHYLSSMRFLREEIYTILVKNIKDKEILTEVANALDKLLFFDIALVFDVYACCLKSQIETTNKKIKKYAENLEEKIIERTKQLEKLANLDALTNCYNRRAMENLLKREIAVAQRRQTRLSFVYFDIDDFKLINDKYGHLKGDEVLKYIGQSMIDTIREVDIPCRYGGDEFCIILPECDAKNAKIICQKIKISLNSKYPEISLSIGIIESGPDKFLDNNQLIKAADDKMYMAKRERRNFEYESNSQYVL